MSACCPSTLKPNPTKIVVPRQHGQILIEPPLPRLAENLNIPMDFPSLQWGGLSTPDISRQLRTQIKQLLVEHAHGIGDQVGDISTQQPWVVTGHQVEFYHAGVWAKVIAAHLLAQQTGAIPIDLLVDHDQLGHLGFEVPYQARSSGTGKTDVPVWHRKRLGWLSEPPNHTLDGLPAPDLAAFESWDAAIGNYPYAQSDSLATVLAALRPQPAESYTRWMSRGRKRLENILGVQVYHLPTSLLCSSRVPAWLLFVLEWIRNAASWSTCYNRQLAAYRTRAGIQNLNQPMPDLWTRQNLQELPFWIYQIGQPRHRLFLKNGTHLLADELEIPLSEIFSSQGWPAAEKLATLLNQHHLEIRPRALTLTMFTRLFISNLFIHGIGGALYDQITDGIMQELFQITPPYACVSAAWLLPLGGSSHAENLAAPNLLRHWRHHIQHNPQIALDPFTARMPSQVERISRREKLLAQISASLAAHRLTQKAQRRHWFHELHNLNSELHQLNPNLLAKIDLEYQDSLHDQTNRQTQNWREYYFGLHSLESLTKFIQTMTPS